MRKSVGRMTVGIGVAAFVGLFFAVGWIPDINGVGKVGELLVRESGIVFGDGREGTNVLAEMLGGQTYLYDYEETDEQRLVLKENRTGIETLSGEGAVNGTDVEDRAAGETYGEESAETIGKSEPLRTVRKNSTALEKLRNTSDADYLIKNFYIVDSTTSVKKKLFDVKKLLGTDLKLAKSKGKKQILIYHTHGASEGFCDSRAGRTEDSVIGVGTELAKELEKRGYGVYHDNTPYDWINGRLERSLAYNKALDGIQKIRTENPDIKVIIDLHRDSVGKGRHTYTTVNGKKTAIVMFFNGLSRNRRGDIAYLDNPNLQGNLAFSLQMKCKAMEYYDGLTKPIYLKGYRYNLHLEKRSLLIELGNENNTVAEAKNAAAPLADVLDKVLSGKG